MSYPASHPRTHRVRIARNTPVKLSARQHLELSQLRLDQLQLMGRDLDVDAFKLIMHEGGVLPIDIAEAIEDANVSLTIAGASTLSVPILDRDRRLLRSGRLSSKQDVKVDGLWFRLANIDKRQDTLDLIFEGREIGVLRTYASPLKAGSGTSRTKVTRAEFILRMLKEVKEFNIPYVIPELYQIQPIGNSSLDLAPDVANQQARATGIPNVNTLTVKSQQMSPTQIKNANIMLNVAHSNIYPRAIMVMMIMAAIQESSITNYRQPQPGDSNWISVNPDKNPVGVLQQIKYWGWPATRDIAIDTTEFLKRLSVQYNSVAGPKIPYWQLIENVQRSGHGSLYGQWRTEAERIVTAYGMDPSTQAAANSQWAPPANTNTGDYEFYRGIPPVQGQTDWLPESSWECILRLAREVDWYAFFVSGTFYYMSGPELMLSKPRMRITEGVKGVDWIDGNYDENKKVASLSVTCRFGRWAAPPGAVVELYDMGPFDGRWLVTKVDRSLFNDNGTITIEKPHPKLPEPLSSGLSQANSGSAGWTPPTNQKPTDQPKRQQYRVPGNFVQPVVKGFAADPTHGGFHQTLGLPGYPAYDFWGKPGDPVVAPENGQIIRFSGHDPKLGPINNSGLPGGVGAAGGPLGWSIYLQGDSGAIYYLTHLATLLGEKSPPPVKLPLHVGAGLVIATIADYDKWGRRSHTHVGVNSDKSGSVTIYDLGSAALAVQG